MRRIAGLMVAVLAGGVVAAGPAAAAPTCFGKAATIVGTDGDDELNGTPGRDVIFAGRGDDEVHGRGGADLICGGSGEDVGLYGDAGNDRIDAGTSERTTKVYGGKGNDFLFDAPGGGDGQEMFGGPGDDVLKAGDSNGTYNDMLDGGPGNDVMEHGRAESTFIGGPGDDVMRGGQWNGDFDVLILGAAPGPVEVDLAAGTLTGWGNDTIEEIEVVQGGRFGDTISGDDERNYFIGGLGDDVLSGRGGNDCLLGAATDVAGWQRCLFPYDVEPASGDDRLFGDAGDDVLTGADGNDVITGGDGVDTSWFASSEAPVQIDLAAGTAVGEGTDTLQEVEGVVGSRFADTISGTEGPDELVAGIVGPGSRGSYQGTGGDTLRGLGGDDRLDVVGKVDADGGEGSDTVTYAWVGVLGGLTIDLRSDSDTSDNMLTNIENVVGPESVIDIVIHGDDGPNSLTAGGGDDEVFGYGGDDELVGLWGNDELDGGDGTDVLEGGPGPHSGFDICVNGETVRSCEA